MTPTSTLEKVELLALLRDGLARELERVKARALDAAQGATHEENRAEGDKDMRSTEASYVARGLADRAHELELALSKLAALSVRKFAPSDRIESSALITLASEGRQYWYFLVPAAGGERLAFAGVEVQTLTPASPLGRALLGLSQGDEAEVVTPQGTRTYEVLSLV
jgi:transcription elongation GreA/GreB family factor